MRSVPIHLTVETRRMRFLLVHFHLFKNGGSTIEAILEREFPRTFATLHGSSAESALDGEELAAFVVDYQQVAAISSHHLRYPLPVVHDVVFFDCCFFRHPFARLADYEDEKARYVAEVGRVRQQYAFTRNLAIRRTTWKNMAHLRHCSAGAMWCCPPCQHE